MKKRDNAIDFMKMILVLQMVAAHIVQFFPAGSRLDNFSQYANLSTFSGFMFVFGYVSYGAYINREDQIWDRVLKGAVKTLVAYYISAVSITSFVYRELNMKSFIEILLFKRVPGYSEFLLSFVCIYLLTVVIKLLQPLTDDFHVAWIIILVAISLLLTLINYGAINNNILGSIIGTRNYPCFPILQYVSYYLVGLYLAKRKKVFVPLIFFCSVFGTLLFLGYINENKVLPERFPPSFYWIMGGWGIVYLYYLISKYICSRIELKIPDFLLKIGRNTLVFLVASNIVIFICRYSFGEWYDINNLNYVQSILLYIVIMAVCFGTSYLFLFFKGKFEGQR